MKKLIGLVFCLTFLSLQSSFALDQELAQTLKKSMEQNIQRLNNFKKNQEDRKIFDRERDKGLSLHLEEQERWDIQRERGIAEQRRLRAQSKSFDDFGPEYKQDLIEKQKNEKEMNVARERYVETKSIVEKELSRSLKVSEETELDLYSLRPRFDRRKRQTNKWTAFGKSTGGGSSSSSSGSSGAAQVPPPSFDYPPTNQQEYIPVDNFEEMPVPPPMPYDGGTGFQGEPMPFEGGNGEFNPPPGYPPVAPPPPDGWDF